MTLILQEKIVNIFFLKWHIFFYLEIDRNHLYQKKCTREPKFRHSGLHEMIHLSKFYLPNPVKTLFITQNSNFLRIFPATEKAAMLPGYFVNNVKIIRNSSPNSTNQDFDWSRQFRSRQNGKIPYRRADIERKVAAKPPKTPILLKSVKK